MIISAPGVRVTSNEPFMTLGDADDSSTSWDLVLTNTALFETNATIVTSSPVRLSDGVEFDWFSSLTSNTFNLQEAESVDVDLHLFIPLPLNPGHMS